MNRRVLAALLAYLDSCNQNATFVSGRLAFILERLSPADDMLFERLSVALDAAEDEPDQGGVELLRIAREPLASWYDPKKHGDLPILQACAAEGMSAAEALEHLANHGRETLAMLEKRALYEPAAIFVSPKRIPPVRASDVKLGESVRIEPGQSILFEGGVELRFRSRHLMSKEEAEEFARVVRAAKGESEPPPEAA